MPLRHGSRVCGLAQVNTLTIGTLVAPATCSKPLSLQTKAAQAWMNWASAWISVDANWVTSQSRFISCGAPTRIGHRPAFFSPSTTLTQVERGRVRLDQPAIVGFTATY